MTTIKDLRVGDRFMTLTGYMSRTPLTLVEARPAPYDSLACTGDGERTRLQQHELVEVISRADQFASNAVWLLGPGSRCAVCESADMKSRNLVWCDECAERYRTALRIADASSLVVARVAAAVAPRCPSCDGVGLTRTEHGSWWHAACSWHGASLTVPPPAARFQPGDWVQVVFGLWEGMVMQVMAVHDGEPWSYSLTNIAEGAIVGMAERYLEACEAPR